jgi:3-deoxy-manno-octulosonate cytidylyltransferase (CMP-KDO synthetase)
MKSTAILIPARYGSTRFPGKPLAMLNGVPMIKRVYDACIASKIPTYVLTDHQDIYNVIGPNCIMDHDDYENGTERCAGAVSKSALLDQYDQFVNVQGDMPDVTLQMIERCIEWLKYYQISTVYAEMPKAMQDDPNSVKMVRAGDKALWFGRGLTGYGHWHLGIYGYKRNPLLFYKGMEVTQEEQVEKLEQLRWLKAGWDIGCSCVDFNGIEINSPADVTAWELNNKTQGIITEK